MFSEMDLLHTAAKQLKPAQYLQQCKTPYTRCNPLYNRLYNRLYNQENVCIYDTAGYNRLYNRLHRVYRHFPVGPTGCTTGCMNSTMFDSCNPTSNRSIVYTDLQPVVQPVASCIRSLRQRQHTRQPFCEHTLHGL